MNLMPASAHFRANPKLVHVLGENGTSSEKSLTEFNRRGSFLKNRTLHRLRRCVLLALLAATCLTSHAAVDFYSPDANHIWNRLYSGLFVRTSGSAVFDDLMDPCFLRETQQFLSGEANTAAIALLREFVENRDALGQESPLQRAVMQRDLLGMFHWVQRSDPTPETGKLAEALVRAIRHVALTTDELHKLPDNYAVAVGLPGAFTDFDEAQPRRAFLPKDLLADDGAWLALEPRHDRPLAAPVHFQMFSDRSAFDLHFRHPGGRAAGEKYLDELAAFPNPLLDEKPEDAVGQERSNRWLNPKTPQFPPGTMWALVRRAILVDTQGNLVVSPLVESMEVRVYRALADIATKPDAQAFFEWELSRRLLLGKGGFHLMEGRDLMLSPFFSGAEGTLKAYAKLEPARPLVCSACHSAPGIHSVNSRTLRFFTGNLDFEFKADPTRPSEFRATTHQRLAEATVKVANKQASWQQFRRLWDGK